MRDSSPLESVLVRKIIKKLREDYGGFWFKVHGGPYQKAGLPDVIGCLEGQFYGFEVKRPGRKATLLQQKTMEEIARQGGVCSTISSYVEAKSILDSHRPQEEAGETSPENI